MSRGGLALPIDPQFSCHLLCNLRNGIPRASAWIYVLHRGSRSAQPRAVAIVPSSGRSELTLARLQLISIRSPSPSLVFSLFFSSSTFASSRRSVPLREAVSTIFLLSLHLRHFSLRRFLFNPLCSFFYALHPRCDSLHRYAIEVFAAKEDCLSLSHPVDLCRSQAARDRYLSMLRFRHVDWVSSSSNGLPSNSIRRSNNWYLSSLCRTIRRHLIRHFFSQVRTEATVVLFDLIM